MKTVYKVSYKLYFNENLKKVDFHGNPTYPLYIQLTYKRKTTYLKSSYFDIYINKRYYHSEGLDLVVPSLAHLIELEKDLIDFSIKNVGSEFTIESFKSVYEYYGTDLCKETEDGFKVFMFIYFLEIGMQAFGKAISEGTAAGALYEVLNDMKKSVNQDIYQDLVKRALSSNQPYLPLFEFVRERKRHSLKFMNIMEWKSESVQINFRKYLNEKFSETEVAQIERGLNAWLKILDRVEV